jgi:hypothetical protein
MHPVHGAAAPGEPPRRGYNAPEIGERGRSSWWGPAAFISALLPAGGSGLQRPRSSGEDATALPGMGQRPSRRGRPLLVPQGRPRFVSTASPPGPVRLQRRWAPCQRLALPNPFRCRQGLAALPSRHGRAPSDNNSGPFTSTPCSPGPCDGPGVSARPTRPGLPPQQVAEGCQREGHGEGRQRQPEGTPPHAGAGPSQPDGQRGRRPATGLPLLPRDFDPLAPQDRPPTAEAQPNHSSPLPRV